MTNIRLHIAYDGTNYHGWQVQRDVPTVEGHFLAALVRLLDLDEEAEIGFQGASRTDAGVHALGQVASVIHGTDRTRWDFVRGLNALTPDDMCVNHAEIMDDDFNARHDSAGKTYVYRIWNHRFVHPILRNRSWQVEKRLDAEAMHRAGQSYVGEHDYSSFRASDCEALTTVRDIWSVDVERRGEVIEVTIKGSAFLKYMVRIMVGTLVEVGVGRMAPEDISGIIAARDRQAAGPTAQPQGLTLVEVHYPGHPWARRPYIGLREHYE